uniref:Ras GTPase-activating protein 1 n=1 Tax=Schistocephalus solidus TaxID=70667 RepID=A0A0V0J6G2_SCHSO
MAGLTCDEPSTQWNIPEAPEYFHGKLTRQEAETRLRRFAVPNSYLLRLTITKNASERWSYVLSFYTSKFQCMHFKLRTRLNLFQLGGRLFPCLKCVLSRYYQKSIVPGEFLRVPVPPFSPPIEFYDRYVKAVRTYEPPNNTRLGCKPGDDFLVVEDESHPDWMLVTSLQTRQSGYLPKFCLEREFPELIQRLPFFHMDSTPEEEQELLQQNGPYSYLLRLCDSHPGLYTFLLYDGVRIKKYRIELITLWWSLEDSDQTSADSQNASFAEPLSEDTSDASEVHPTTDAMEKTQEAPTPRTKALPKVLYDSVQRINSIGHQFTSVEEFVKAIEEQFNVEQEAAAAADDRSPPPPRIVFRPVKCDPKVKPSTEPIYMAMSYRRRPPSPRAVLEVHGELSQWHHSKKKWKLLYGQLDREHSIITLTSDDKRKPESLDLTRCDYVPIHSMMLDKPYCFGLLLYGATAADREEILYFSVEAPQSSSPSSNFQPPQIFSSFTRLSNSSSSTNPSSSSCGGGGGSGGGHNLDPQAYAGRPLDCSVGQPDFASGFLRPSGFNDFYLCSKSLTPSGSTCGLYSTNTPSALELAYWRWVKALAFHCRNTSQDSDIDADPDRRRSEIRCFRTLEVKLTNAKLLPRPFSARPEGTLFSVSIDGLDIARAYSGTHGQVITFEEFPDGFSTVRVSCREEKKKRTEVLVTIDLQAAGDGPRNCVLPGGRADSADQPARSAVVPICNICEAVSPQATLTYRKLFVLPFQYYDHLREVIATQLETELVPVCMYMWEVLSSDQNNFLSSLLLATIESKTHLELIVNLLKAEISPEQPASAFRSNTLGQQLLDLYMNMVCSEWRQNCFRRVFEETSQENFANFALQHQLNLTASSSSLTGLSSATGAGTLVTPTASSRAAKFSTSHSASLSSEIGCESSSSSGGGGVFAASPSLDPPRQSAVGSIYSTETSSVSHQSSQSCASTSSAPQIRVEWYRNIIKLLIEDMLKYAPAFPLQLRWIYAEIQVGLHIFHL